MNNFPAAVLGDSPAWPPGFPAARAVHELRAPEATASHVAFAAMLLAGIATPAPVLWVSLAPCPYPPGLAWLGLDPARLLFAQAKDDAESLGSLEVALRGGMAGVAEARSLSRLAARRLALAAKQGGGTGFLLRHAPRSTALDSTAFATRWLISPAASQGPPQQGAPRLRAELLYIKGGQPDVFLLEIQGGEDYGSAPPALALVNQAADPAGWQRTG